MSSGTSYLIKYLITLVLIPAGTHVSRYNATYVLHATFLFQRKAIKSDCASSRVQDHVHGIGEANAVGILRISEETLSETKSSSFRRLLEVGSVVVAVAQATHHAKEPGNLTVPLLFPNFHRSSSENIKISNDN